MVIVRAEEAKAGQRQFHGNGISLILSNGFH